MKILIADDHSVVRRGLQQIIDLQPGWSVVAEVTAPEKILAALREQHVDVAVLDVSFGARSGIDVLELVRAEFPALPVLVFSMHEEEQYAIRCLRAGASGYIQKDRSADELVRAIQRVASGRMYISESVAHQLAVDRAEGKVGAPHERLSTREFEVMRLIASGLTITQIAGTLNLSVKTVSTYRTRILAKTGLRSTADITAYAIRAGLAAL